MDGDRCMYKSFGYKEPSIDELRENGSMIGGFPIEEERIREKEKFFFISSKRFDC